MPKAAKPPQGPKPSEIASDTKRNYLPLIKTQYASVWPTHSFLVQNPLQQLIFTDRPASVDHPIFYIRAGDPIDVALSWQKEKQSRIPVICSAHDKRPGGDWETGVQGYEERACRRTSLAAALGTPAAEGYCEVNYPIPSTGAIYSPCVVVFRGPKYETIAQSDWDALPVVSVPALRWPKLMPDGRTYSFADERALAKDKMRGALRLCAYNGHGTVVVAGDWGLGNAHRNPPRECAEAWRDVLLYDPDLRGRIREVAFVFEDAGQSTEAAIRAEMSRKGGGGVGKSGKGKGKGKAVAESSSSGGASSGPEAPKDAEIFAEVFDEAEVRRVLEETDPRLNLNNLLT